MNMAETLTPTQALAQLRNMYEGIRDEHHPYANTATRIGNAFLALLSYLAGAPYLRKDTDDTAAGLLTLLMGCVVGESKQIRLNPDGSIVCGSIRVDGSAIFNELVFNHQNVLEGDTYFTDKGIIEKVEHTDIGQYTLTFRKEYDADHHTFHVNDILLGKVNRLDTGKTHYSFWLRVDKVDTEANTAICSLYADSDVPGGKNYAPVPTARVIRWGNTVDNSRQSVWFVSSNDGRWLFLQGVDKPIVEDSEHGSNYAAFVGLPPDIQAVHDLLQKGVISKEQPCLYAKTILAENIIQLDYLGKPMYQARDCGQWNASRKYIKGWDDTAKGYYKDRVWWKGCYWECSVDECSGSEPRYGNTYWTCLIGGSNMSIELVSSAGNFFRSGTKWTTTIEATVWNAEMELTADDLKDCTLTWTRESDDSKGDMAWNASKKNFHEYALPVSSQEDLPSGWTAGSKVGYRCTLTFPDGNSTSASYSIVK